MWGVFIVGYIAVAGLISFFWEENQNYYRAYWWEDWRGFLLVVGWIIVLPCASIFAIGRFIAYFFQCLFDRCKSQRKRRH